MGSELQMLHHQDTKHTKFHQEKHVVNFVFLGVLGPSTGRLRAVLVVKFLFLFFARIDY